MKHAFARMLPVALALLFVFAPQAAAAQDFPQPEPDATFRVRLPTVQSSQQFDAGTCACQQNPGALAGQAVPNQYIVLMHEGEARMASDGSMVSTAAIAADAVAQAGGELLYIYDNGLDGFAAVLPPQTVAALQADPRVAAVVPDTWVVLDPPPTESDAAPAFAFASGDSEWVAESDLAATAGSAVDGAAATDTFAEPAIATT